MVMCCVFFEVRNECSNIMRSLHVVCEMDACGADHVCLYVRMIQIDNRLTDLDVI